jgi:hypothetical protein
MTVENTISVPADAPNWAHALAGEIRSFLARRGSQPTRTPKFLIAKLPPAQAWAGAHVFILDTNRPAYSDGTDWRYTATDTAI